VPLLFEDLPQFGVFLTPGDDAGSAALHNRSHSAIVSVAFMWIFSDPTGRTQRHCFLPGTNPSIILPFGLDQRQMKIHAYQGAIFSGSRRILKTDGSISGDNSDVRPPGEDEVWREGTFCVRAGSPPRDGLEPVKLTLDGVIFADGAFAGPNNLGLFEHAVFAAEAHLECAALARQARENSQSPAVFFSDIKTRAGIDGSRTPPPPPPRALRSNQADPEPIRTYERNSLGRKLFALREHFGDESILARIEAWADAAAPKFHRLS
jgi:hypothetical protein